MPSLKPLVPPPMHPLGSWRERIKHAWATTKLLADLLRHQKMAVTRHGLSRRIGEVVAVPAAPRPVGKCMQLFYSTPTLTNKIVPLAAEAPRHLLGAKRLVRQIDKPVAPGLGPNTLPIGLLAPFPPVAGVPTHISGAPHRANINNSGPLYRPRPVRFMSPATIELPLSLEPAKVMSTSLAARITTGNSSRPG